MEEKGWGERYCKVLKTYILQRSSVEKGASLRCERADTICTILKN